VLALFWVIGVWGLRQRPGLVRRFESEVDQPELPPAQKYEKSALDAERANRIARKIEAAMSQDLLYREPDLSLWDLAKHIGVTSHYVSQTLNTHLGKSFFELVNGWRIKDALTQLKTTDATILVIAYDVGFNSRSAFYKAFKRETGKTPSDLRD
jgi:AraC-like DNA-binding protein